MISVADLHKAYSGTGPAVLDGIDLEVTEGELLCVVGRSGSGKTTLLNILGGLDTAYDGRVTVAGRRLDQLPDDGLSHLRNECVGLVLQDSGLIDGFDCMENVMLPALFRRRRARAEELEARAAELLDLVGIVHLARSRPAELSGGERQRLGLARALLNRPPVLLVDELTGNLDSETATEAMHLLVGLRRDHGVTILAATHDVEVARAADRVLRLADGKLSETVAASVLKMPQ